MGDEKVRCARSTVLRLRGLPFQSTEAEIERFFQGFTIKKCVVCRRNGKELPMGDVEFRRMGAVGRGTGEAYVQLESEAHAGKALNELNCKYLGRRYIELFEAIESDIVSQATAEWKGVAGFVLRLRGLPYTATTADISLFFDGLGICKSNESIILAVTAQGRPTGEAYVEFVDEQNQQEAMKKHKHHMGRRYIELFKSTKADLIQALQQNRFYKEQAEKRHMLACSFIGTVNTPQHHPGLQPYSIPYDDVSKILKDTSLNTQNDASLMLSPFRSPMAIYDPQPGSRLPLQQYLHPGFMNPHYYLPEQVNNQYSLTATLPTRGQIYDASKEPRGSLYGMAPLRQESMTHQQTPYLMPPPMIQHPQQMMIRYPPQPSWNVNSPLNPLEMKASYTGTPTLNHFSATWHKDTVPSPSGPIETPFSSTTASTAPERSFPNILRDESELNLIR